MNISPVVTLSGDDPFQAQSQPQTNSPEHALTGQKVTPKAPKPLGLPGSQALTPKGLRSNAETQG